MADKMELFARLAEIDEPFGTRATDFMQAYSRTEPDVIYEFTPTEMVRLPPAVAETLRCLTPRRHLVLGPPRTDPGHAEAREALLESETFNTAFTTPLIFCLAHIVNQTAPLVVLTQRYNVNSLLSVTYRLPQHHSAVLSPLGAALLFSPDGASTLVFMQSVRRNKYGHESVSVHLPGPVDVGGLNTRDPLSFFLWQHATALAPSAYTSSPTPLALMECLGIFISLHAVSEDTIREIVHLPLAEAVWDLLAPPMKSLAQARPWALNDALREALIGSCTPVAFDGACIEHILRACLAHPCGRSNVLAVLEATVYRCSRDTRIAQSDTERMAENFRTMVKVQQL